MLDERTKQILFAVVQSYISKPDPVGSRFVTKKYSFGISPATIRNIMADLEELGFLNQPHTSAGRVPTDKGYRFYVDTLLSSKSSDYKLQTGFADQLENRLDQVKNDLNSLFSEATTTLSSMSNYVGIALPPKPERTTFDRIDLLRYKGDHVVAVLITDEGVIKNKIVRTDSALNQDDLNRIADYLNSEYSGYTLDEIKGILIKRMRDEKVVWDKLIMRAIDICKQAISFSAEDIFVSGMYDVVNLPDFSDISRIKEMARAIKDKHLILTILDELSASEGVQVLIGTETNSDELQSLSIVASPCKESNKTMGIVALIGPKRMDYPKAICMVDIVAKCISRTLGSN